MKKEFQLTIGERVAAAKIFDGFKGALSALSVILDDIKGIVVTPTEWDAAKLVKTPGANGTENWSWTDEGSDKAISLSVEAVDYLRKEIKTKSDANEITLQDKALIGLDKKLTA